MAHLVQSIMRSTIGVRLVTVVLAPMAGLLLFGFLAARDEQEAVMAARELRQNAQLVEILAAASVALDIETETDEGIRQAGSFGVDFEQLITFLGPDETGVDPETGLLEADRHLAVLASQDPDDWAHPQAVQQILETRDQYWALAADPEATGEERQRIRQHQLDAGAEALSAQLAQLNLSMVQIELDHDLTARALSIQPTLELSTAAREERNALAAYLLPLTDESTEERYRNLVGANAHFEQKLEEVANLLPTSSAADLDDVRASTSWQLYSTLRDEVLLGQRQPASGELAPVDLLPVGLTTYVHGFERTQLLLDLNLELSRSFAASAYQLESEAQNRLIWDVTVLGAMAVFTLALSFVVTRSITWPLRALLDRARDITEGDLSTGRPSGGPADFGMVHAAFDEMAANLRTVADQAEALSAGRLDDEVLSHTVHGSLGASVHGSVARLRSMTSRLEYEATHDALTRLPNRAAVLSFLDKCLTGEEAARTPISVIMLDLDGFKLANDNMGHSVGDEVLVTVAERIQRGLGDAFAARLGGDEFMVVVTGRNHVEAGPTLARTIIEAISEPTKVSTGSLQISASAGVVEVGKPNWLSPTEVLRRVDLALYQAKADGPGQVVRFDRRLHDTLLATTQLQGELRRALSFGEFELHLQPIVAIASGDVTGYEALIRWHSETRGQVSPGLFIPVAEQSELITHIDSWVIARAAEIMGAWRGDTSHEPLSLSVNVSARHLSHVDLAGKIEAGLSRNEVDPQRLMVEVTESQLIPNLSRAEDTLRHLRDIGVRLAIDDFGTGYASVAHLRSVAFDRLKIDQSFLAHLDDDTERSLASLLVSLGRDLDLEVVAEGIETEAQYEWATSAGCTHAQGYLLGHPTAAPQGLLLPTGR